MMLPMLLFRSEDQAFMYTRDPWPSVAAATRELFRIRHDPANLYKPSIEHVEHVVDQMDQINTSPDTFCHLCHWH